MIQKTIEHLEEKLKDSNQVPKESQEELLKLFKQLKEEVNTLAESELDKAKIIALHTDSSAKAAIEPNTEANLLENSINDFKKSIGEFEATHPKLVESVNRICTTLSNMGI